VYTVGNAVSYPFALQTGIGNLPAGSFPTGAFALIGFNPTATQNRFVQQNPPRSYSMDWNLNIQREFTPTVVAKVGYVGSRTIHNAFTEGDVNFVLPTLTSAGYLWPFPVGSGTKLNPNVGPIRPTSWDSDAYYEGFQAQLIKRMSRGLQAQAAYTWSKCIDTGSGGAIGDPFTNSIATLLFFDKAARRGLCDFNIAHNFVLNFIGQLPKPRLGSAVAQYVLGGWQMGGVLEASTGTPFTVLMGGDPLGLNNTDASAFPNRLWGTPGCGNPINPGNVGSYLKLNCFSPPTAPASFAAMCQPAAPSVASTIPNTCLNLMGNAGRNQVVGPGLLNLDFSLVKNNLVPSISESFNVQMRFEFFNILNHANFQSPIDNSTLFNQDGTSVGGAGSIDATTTQSRQIQFGLKVIW
jgi:hypothetical protein